MRIGYEISQHLKNVKSQDGNERTVRAMMVANALGYHFPIDPSKSSVDNSAENAPAARKIIGQINENISLDSRLTLELFKQVVAIRYELLMGCVCPSIVEAAMRSGTAEIHQTPAETATVLSLVSNVDFMKTQNGIQQVLQSMSLTE